ncbi:MAG: DUF4271 domain-containing protein [Bacteroidota bacterium]
MAYGLHEHFILQGYDSLQAVAARKEHHKRDSIRLLKKADSAVAKHDFEWKDLKPYAELRPDSVKTAPSVFKGHHLQAHRLEPLPSAAPDNSFSALILLLLVLLLAVARQSNVKRFNDIMQAFFVHRSGQQLLREEYSLLNRTSVVLLIVFVFSAALFLYQLASYFGLYVLLEYGAASYLLFCGIVVLIYFVKIAVLRVLAYIFKTEAIFSEYVFYILLFNQVLGLALVLITASVAFARLIDAHYLMLAGIFLVVSMLIYRILRGAFAALSHPNVSRFYLFLYLCTLEFLPMAIMVKAFNLIFGN